MSDQEALRAARARRRALLEAAQEVERAIARPTGTGSVWRERVATELSELSVALEDHIVEVEDEDGLLNEIVEQAPRLSNAVAQMRAEHVELRDAVAELLAATTGAEGTAEELREEVVAFLGKVVRHRQRGADLVWDAYDVDIGGLG